MEDQLVKEIPLEEIDQDLKESIDLDLERIQDPKLRFKSKETDLDIKES